MDEILHSIDSFNYFLGEMVYHAFCKHSNTLHPMVKLHLLGPWVKFYQIKLNAAKV